jgi:hypothetical protein
VRRLALPSAQEKYSGILAIEEVRRDASPTTDRELTTVGEASRLTLAAKKNTAAFLLLKKQSGTLGLRGESVSPLFEFRSIEDSRGANVVSEHPEIG